MKKPAAAAAAEATSEWNADRSERRAGQKPLEGRRKKLGANETPADGEVTVGAKKYLFSV